MNPKIESVLRHTAYILFFALLLAVMERFGNSAKAFVAGASVGLVVGPVAMLFFLAKPIDEEETKEPPRTKKKEKI